jgi:tetratricopeptide (TPR) repeat protein
MLLALMLAPIEGDRFAQCVRQVQADPAAAVTLAEQWRDGGGGIPARQCLGLAYTAVGRYAPAAAVFTQAAKDAELQRDADRAAVLWVLAGNASLGGGDAAVARTSLTRGLSLSRLDPAQTGEALLDRARAAVAAGDTKAARGDIDNALGLVAGDPMAWLLSATLARRQGDPARATKDIAEAERRAPGHPAVAYEAGNIAMTAGDRAGARDWWTKAAAAKDDPSAESAKAALAANPL